MAIARSLLACEIGGNNTGLTGSGCYESERIKKKIYRTRDEARSDIFDYIEMFYEIKSRHGSSEQMQPDE